MTMTPPLRVAYLVSQYPALSHSFIEREIEALRAHGVEVETFTVRRSDPDQLTTQLMRDEAARTPALRTAGPLDYAQAALALLRQGASSAVTGGWKAWHSGRSDPRSKLWQGFYLAEAILLHRWMLERDLRHVHAHFANVAADVARLVVALGRAQDGADSPWRWSFTMHGPTEFEDVPGFDLAAKVADADGVSCISDFCRSQLMRLLDPQSWDKLSVVRMSVDSDRYAPPRMRSHPEESALRLLNVGRLVPEKGAPILLDAVTDLTRRGLDVQLRIAGAGPLESTLRRTVTERGLTDHVRLLGPVSQDALPELYGWADAFVLPSFQEGLPVVLMEALATELPVVTTTIAGIGELVRDGATGRLVPPGRADLLAAAIAELAADPTARRTWGRAGRDVVLEEFTAVTTGPAMRNFLRQVQTAQPASGRP